MNKTLQVAQHEYQRHVFNKRFLMGLFSVPLIIVLMAGLVLLVLSMQTDSRPVGYIDNSGLLANPLPAPKPEPPDRPVPMQPFKSEATARSALEASKLQAYYLVPQDYRSSGKLEVVAMGEVKSNTRQQFYAFLAINLLRDSDPSISNRLTNGTEVIVQSPDGSRSISSKDWLNIFVPMIAGLAFMVIMFSAGGYLMQAVVEEKENRTMEMIITSVSPDQFMTGKILGNIAIAVTMVLAWGLFIIVPVLIGRNYIKFLQGIQILPHTIILLIFIMLPAFVMMAALMATIGATVTEAREGQQVIGFLSLPVWIPYMLMAAMIGNPNSPLAVTLSLLPVTAPLTMLFRDGITILPLWQIALSSFIQIACAAGTIWLAGRAFRLGMLRYGKKVAWRELFARLEGRV